MALALSFKQVRNVRKKDVDDMLLATKDVMRASDRVRHQLREQVQNSPDA
ncbi:hypothetical protein EDD33_1833 [Nocardioides aurantiacus]|uniref:Uncharacterized protein n=1 Tax=Nocardioides aurantiacus TaxID=86796 RepID=A0A3N2CU35_9ACTN|nr:hypothetical protein EDD33_1833 [Nocardioides aurantiacus]